MKLLICIQKSVHDMLPASAIKGVFMAGVDEKQKQLSGRSPLFKRIRNKTMLMFTGAALGLVGSLNCVSTYRMEQQFIDSVVKGRINVNATDKHGRTALMLAAMHKYLGTSIEFLIEKGADENAKDSNGGTALMYGAFNRDAEYIIKPLLEHGADVNARNKHGNNALMQAAFIGSTNGAALLIEYGADVSAKNIYGTNALMMAAWSGQIETAKLLLEHGADVNAKDNDGQTALMMATTGVVRYPSWPIETAKLLLQNGADVNATDNKGRTAYDWAIKNGQTKIATVLRNYTHFHWLPEP